MVAAASASAAGGGKEFSAETVQRGPKGEMTTGKMYVGDQRIRTEMSHQGQQIIRVTDENRGVEWVLFPEQKKYMERTLAAAGGKPPAAKPSQAQDPCGGMQVVTFNKIGEEEVGGRPAVKWEIVAPFQGEEVKTIQWIDKDRGVPLRSEMPNGQVSELKLVGTETVDGRELEKWEMVATAPDQPATRSFQWYDPELELAVRQEFPGGMVSEMKNIRVGKQPDELFNIPAGYERMTMPQGMPGGSPGGAVGR
jgi:hypothetical protein